MRVCEAGALHVYYVYPSRYCFELEDSVVQMTCHEMPSVGRRLVEDQQKFRICRGGGSVAFSSCYSTFFLSHLLLIRNDSDDRRLLELLITHSDRTHNV